MPRQLEDVLAVLEEVVLGEQRPELAHLVPPPRQKPVVAEELVLLDVREHGPRQPQQVVERLADVLGQERAVLFRQTLALGLDLLGRALDLLARAQRADVADQSRVRNARIVEPAAVVVVQPVAGRHVEPRVLDGGELGQPRAPGLAVCELGVDLVRSAPFRERAVDVGVERQRASRRSSASGRNISTSIPATICAMCWSGMSGRLVLHSSANVA